MFAGLPPGFRPEGVVFDVDGTLVDNMPLHAEAFERFAARYGLPAITMSDRARLDGKRNREIFPVLFGRPIDDAELARLEDEKESLYRALSAGRLSPLGGLDRLLASLEAAGIPIALATSAPAPNVTHTLAELGLSHLEPRTVRSDEVPHGKPFPDVFLAAAARIGVAPPACLAFEDAPMGIEAARRAGMVTVAITTSFDGPALAAHDWPPHAAFRDYSRFLDEAGTRLLGLEAVLALVPTHEHDTLSDASTRE